MKACVLVDVGDSEFGRKDCGADAGPKTLRASVRHDLETWFDDVVVVVMLTTAIVAFYDAAGAAPHLEGVTGIIIWVDSVAD